MSDRRKEMKKKIGRPRKKEGVISFPDFQRVGIVGSLYDEARESGQKHSVAVGQTVELIKQRYPTMRISETLVKRILATWRPRGSHNILLFKVKTRNREELAKHRNDAQLAAMSQEKGSKLSAPSDVVLPSSVTTFGMTLGERPTYPRHNRKPPKV